MLIMWALPEDKSSWTSLAEHVSAIFGHPSMAQDKDFHAFMDSKLSKFEALIAIDRMSQECLGIIAFSKTHNRISWFAVFNKHRSKGVGTRLLSTALRQLDNTKEVSVITFAANNLQGLSARITYQKAGFVEKDPHVLDTMGNPRCKMVLAPTHEKRGGSFHYHYSDYDKYTKIENCLCCNHVPPPDHLVDIAQLSHSVLTAKKIAQGKLFGKCHVLINNHHVNFEELPKEDIEGFMSDVQQATRALKKVTSAVKINYEIHSNSAPHIHCHLFSRYLDDDFPGAPIDYRITHPSPYESEEEFLWFVDTMKKELLVTELP